MEGLSAMNTTNISISIAKDFSQFPAGRYPGDGKFNGTRFRKEKLVPALEKARESSGVVKVDFDGVAGFGSSFLEEAFGGLIREEGMEKGFLDQHLKLSTLESDLQDFVDLAEGYIQKAYDNND